MIRCLAVDDETPALDILEDNIRQVPFLQLVKKCKNAYAAMEILGFKPVYHMATVFEKGQAPE